MTELIICLLPLGIIFLGIVLLTQLAMGRQEAARVLGWYLGASSDDSRSEISGRFYRNDKGTVVIPDKRLNAPPQPVAQTEEPVLPYGDIVGGDAGAIDLAAAVERSVFRTIRADGTVHTNDSKGVARKLARLGIITNYDDVVGAAADLDRDKPSETGIVTFELDNDVLRMVADVLGGSRYGSSGGVDADAWLRYARVEVASYTGGLRSLGMGAARLHLETDDAGAELFRSDFTLGDKGGEGDKPLAMLEGVNANPDAGLGRHPAGSSPDVELERISAKISVERDGNKSGDAAENVDPTSQSLMRRPLDNPLPEDWSKSRGLL